ncbi:hypothetical protein D9M71_746640 [compost metagenome]
MSIEMIAKLGGGITGATIHGVPNHASPARVRNVNPQLALLLLQITVHVEVADARFDNAKSLFLVDFNDAIQTLEV